MIYGKMKTIPTSDPELIPRRPFHLYDYANARIKNEFGDTGPRRRKNCGQSSKFEPSPLPKYRDYLIDRRADNETANGSVSDADHLLRIAFR